MQPADALRIRLKKGPPRRLSDAPMEWCVVGLSVRYRPCWQISANARVE